MSKFKNILLMVVITFGLLEVGSCILLKANVLQGDLPSFKPSKAIQRFWIETDPSFGVWHTPNSVYEHQKTCFDVTYHANSLGMRDKERQVHSDHPRVAMIGDSLIEGWAVPDGHRLSDLLEQASGVEYLNFGTSGYFSPTQYFLMYQSKVKAFDPQQVIVGIYPFNDFSDDDYELWKNRDRYRPFWVGTYPDYKLVYSKDKPNGVFHSKRYASELAADFSYAYNVIAQLVRQRRMRDNNLVDRPDGATYSDFYDFKEEGFLRMRFSLEKLRAEMGDKKLTILLIPAPNDFPRYQKFGKAPLAKRIEAFAQANPNTEVIDMLEEMAAYSKDWKKYFFDCDQHLNSYGNQVMFEIYRRKTSTAIRD